MIMKRYEKTGVLPNMILKNPVYGDFSSVPNYQEALNIVRIAQEQFNGLDASVRNRFDNDPAKFLDFATNPENVEQMAKMGLLKPEVVAARKAAMKAKSDAAKEALAAEKAAEKAALIAEIKAELNK